ncbi:MAG TPA: rhodanese-like domain-containing protein [Symbiobacteriaceae bacterium]|nr:rhodanese-like domain-containing protein [Symbiobacteriaceae bacterium]
MAERSLNPLITPTELAGRIREGKAPVMIDVREVDEFAEGHIPGAINLPLSNFTNLYQQIPKDQEVALICRSSNRSGRAHEFLVQQGWQLLRNMSGGMLSWQGPVE